MVFPSPLSPWYFVVGQLEQAHLFSLLQQLVYFELAINFRLDLVFTVLNRWISRSQRKFHHKILAECGIVLDLDPFQNSCRYEPQIL